ncbi:restriction endonuclease subunit S [Cellulomonas sp. Sa3CUA2]|uniref:Restriction endonuclease subunit S n=1 Tax=Cellulomonas avistercoris TaxID=2762242 RepID=A0ABR8QAN1_9CELL|nr:restriction endonuclease subunit S [Cellulomonas avistercoris]MBD7917480.1 restriction endonuclease subunit S [Cellulomonas avistercoris]
MIPTVHLGDVATIERAGVDPSDLPPDTRYLGLEHIERGGRIISYETVGAAGLASTKFRFSRDHVLFGKLRPNLGKIARPEFDGVSSTDILPIRPGMRLDRDYLTHYLRQPSVVQYAATRATGANLPRLSPSALAAFEIPLPPIEEQRRIAAILDQAGAIRTKRRQVLAHLDALAESTFHAMFEGEPATATVADIGSSIRTGPFGSQLLHSEFVDEGVAVLGLDNVVGNDFRWGERRFITPAKYERLKRYTVQPGDVLISIMGTTGRCVVVPDGIPTAINTKHICAITADRSRVEPAFLRASFLWHPTSREHLRRQTKGSIMDGLNMGIIKAMPVPTPGLDRQKEYVARVAAVDAQRAVVGRALAADDELFGSLQSRAFQGEL